jgi:hypothetical protein
MLQRIALLAVYVALVSVSNADKHDGLYMAVGEVEIRPPPPPPPPNPALDALIKKYNTTREKACAEVTSKAPTLDGAEFMSAYQGFACTSASNCTGTEEAVMDAARKLAADTKLVSFLSLPDSFSAADGLDAAMAKCAVMTAAGRGELIGRGTAHTNLLANFALQGAAEEALVDKLLGDAMLMRDMLVAGGPKGGHYGEAMAIYSKLLATSSDLQQAIAAAPTDATLWDDRSPANVLKRLAVGTAVGLATPLLHRFGDGAFPNGTRKTSYVDPIERYAGYVKAYKAGDLDPAFPILTAFELSHTIDADSKEEDLTWLRPSMANFRPDDIAMDYHWRYAESVHTDVAYGDSHCALFNNGTGGVCEGHFSDIPVGGDVCGGRAFWGRFACKGFGRPTWGATEHAHAAMSAWTPTGWTVLLGAPWPDCWWGDVGGLQFVLETQARENRSEYQKILRTEWVGLAKDEDPAPYAGGGGARIYAKGGLWSALSVYMQKIVANESEPMNRTLPAPNPAANKIDAALAYHAEPPAPPAPITTGADGTIMIPGGSFASKNHSAPVSVIKSFTEGTQMLSNGCTSSVGPPCFDPPSSSVTYEVTPKAAGTYYLTANFSSWHMDQDLFVSVNGAKEVEVGMFYTLGSWNESQPVEVALTAGKNTLVFTRTTGRDVMYKSFLLYQKKPAVSPPPGNFTPTPAPPMPNANQYIEVRL